MPGVRRRLRDVGKKVSGVLGVMRDDDPDQQPDDVDVETVPASADRSDPAPDPPATEEPALTTTQLDDQPSGTDTLDPVAAGAVELARAVAVEEAGEQVGAHLGVQAEQVSSGSLVTHSFASTDPAYVGWRWAVTVSRAEGGESVTVDEVVLLPGEAALLAPPWVPWSERIAAGDLAPGDLLPPPPDDPRLVPSYADVSAERLPFDLDREMWLGRPRVLSWEGRADAAERWYAGDAGPDTAVAKAAPATCASCGFLTPLAGALGTVFGACANDVAVDDGRVVAISHGCGAHSETVLDWPESSYAGMAVEHDELELVELAGGEDPDGEAPSSSVEPDRALEPAEDR